MAEINLDSAKMNTYCAGMESSEKGQCYADAASRIIETDSGNIGKTVGFCALAAQNGEGDVCYGQLARHSAFEFNPGSPEFIAYCNALPSSWQQECLSRRLQPSS